MPEPLLFVKSMVAAAVVSAIIVLAMAGWRRDLGTVRVNLASLVAMACGLAVGYFLLALNLAWPPRNGLDRLLLVVFPAAILIEGIATIDQVSTSAAWFLRISLAVLVPRALLHDSVYLSNAENNLPQLVIALVAGGALLAGVWSLVSWLSERSPGVSIPISLGLAIQCAGIAIMLAGYIKGGAAAIPLAATIIATSVTSAIAMKLVSKTSFISSPAMMGIGVVGLFGLLLIGRFFGRLSTEAALMLLLAPLLCWATEIPLLRKRKPWFVEFARITLVAIPLVIVLVFAKRDFDQRMAPLLGIVIPSTERATPL